MYAILSTAGQFGNDVIAAQNVQNDTGKLATGVAKERELSAKLISDLSANISLYKKYTNVG